MPDLVVVKYGGSVLKDAESFRAAAGYQIKTSPVALVSAMNGVTNWLMNIYEKRNHDLSDLRNRYWDIAKYLSQTPHEKAMEQIEKEINLLRIYMDIGARDAFVGSAEGHSAILLASYINEIGGDAERLTGPEAGFILNDHGQVDVESSRNHLGTLGKTLKTGKTVVVGGYLGKDLKTKQYKLGARNINDAFAVALADALDATSVEIVKDVPGVYRVPPEFGDFGLVERLSYDEARKMSWRRSPVVHPAAIRMARDKNMPIVVKDMTSRGTVISGSQTATENPVAALVPEMTYMVTVRDDIMDTPEGRDYHAMIHQFEKEAGTDTGIIASDVGGISYTVALGDRKRGQNTADLFIEHDRELRARLNSHGYKPTIERQEVGMLTVVGDGLQNKTGALSYLSGVLGNNGISIRAAVQSDERYVPPSITFVVDVDALNQSVRALAEELFAA